MNNNHKKLFKENIRENVSHLDVDLVPPCIDIDKFHTKRIRKYKIQAAVTIVLFQKIL